MRRARFSDVEDKMMARRAIFLVTVIFFVMRREFGAGRFWRGPAEVLAEIKRP